MSDRMNHGAIVRDLRAWSGLVNDPDFRELVQHAADLIDVLSRALTSERERADMNYDHCKRAEQDALRYEWLKNNEHADLATELALEIPSDDWDAAIDKAMKP